MRISAVLLLLVLSGCSFVFARGTADGDEPGGRRCASIASPVVDAAITLAALAALAYAQTSSGCDEGDRSCKAINRLMSGVLFGTPAAIYGVSALYGGAVIGNCRERRAVAARRT